MNDPRIKKTGLDWQEVFGHPATAQELRHADALRRKVDREVGPPGSARAKAAREAIVKSRSGRYEPDVFSEFHGRNRGPQKPYPWTRW